ncbi:CPBP family intramembrane metalloprotease [Flammeovirga pectinis]|uniref:CPBP family intramembrane metalloprotease n=1 Tax=Flammeovirga pectinis TaxID=2494373 RepID=A0A3Q9FPC6_9BACT|nr:type II CAAX endopeptidase family protein [Flammeovirga pectinis]AZQ64766.1 CPBP family intramembrane metalloprotease [Flammeovirga pectinis]
MLTKNAEPLRPFLSDKLKLNWKFSISLLLLVCIPRFYLVLKANVTQNYSSIGLIMLLSGLIPFVFLNKSGLKEIGVCTPNKYYKLLFCLIIGILFSYILYLIGINLFGVTYENWYVYIRESYNIPNIISIDDKMTLFIIMSITGMIFSPLGEELFFRGLVHTGLSNSLGNRFATVIDSLSFALVHISHFGILYINDSWKFYPMPTIIWVISMFIVSLLFIKMKNWTHSIWGAVVGHAGFNLGMIYAIFYLI